jgi:hypothetical protein
MKNEKIIFINIIFCIIILLICSSAQCMMIDEQDLCLGNLYDFSGVPTYLPNSNFVIDIDVTNVTTTKPAGEVAVVDIKKARFLGHFTDPDIKDQNVAVLTVENGWDVYLYTTDSYLSKIHVDNTGDLSELKKLVQWQTSNMISFQKKNKIYAFTNRIYEYNPETNEVKSYRLPEDFPIDKTAVGIHFLSEIDSVIFSDSSYSVSYILDLNTLSSVKLEETYSIKSIKPWMGHGNKYLCLISSDTMYISSFDPVTQKFEVLFKEIPILTQNLALDDNGKYIYAMVDGANDLFKFDTENKSYEFIDFGYDETYIISLDRWFYIPGKDKILTGANVSRWGPGSYRTAIIDITNKNIELLDIPDLWYKVEKITPTPIYFAELNRIVSNEGLRTLNIIDVDTDKPIDTLKFNGNSLSSLKLSMGNMGIFTEPYFIMLDPTISWRKFYQWGNWIRNWTYYPDGHGIVYAKQKENIITMEINIFDYNPQNGQTRMFDIPTSVQTNSYSYYLFSNPSNINVIALPDDSSKLYLIEDFNRYDTIANPHPDISISNRFFDEKSGYLWLFSIDDSSGIISYFKFNSIDGSFTDLTYTDFTGSFVDNIFLNDTGKFFLRFGDCNLYAINPDTGKTIFKTLIFSAGDMFTESPALALSPDYHYIYLWDGSKAWKIDTSTWKIVYGEVNNDPIQNMGDCKGIYDSNRDEFIVFDTIKTNTVMIIDPETGSVKQSQIIVTNPSQYLINPILDLENRSIYFIDNYHEAKLATVRLDDTWDNAPTIKPQGQFVEYRPGDTFKLTLDIANPVDTPQDATAYIWFWLPTGQYVFFGPNGLTTDVVGIPLTLPVSLDTSISIDLFTVPQGMPSGFYNLNAVFFNNRTAVRGPMGTYNFMAAQ